nr:class F sortase [Nocardiopsis sinuspersici]
MLCASLGTVLLALGATGNDGLPRPPDVTTESETRPPNPPSDSEHVAPLPDSAPVALSISAIDLHTTHLVELGLTPDHRLEAPRDWQAVGWYTQGPSPGQTGPAIMAGHLDSETGPAVFHRLEELRPQDTITIERADDTVARFTVYAVEQHSKGNFPTNEVYGDTDRPELRLITCGGDFNPGTRHYTDNVIVYARITATVDRPEPPESP